MMLNMSQPSYLKIPIFTASNLKCSFENPLPSSTCSSPGYEVELTLRLLQLLFYGKPPKAKFFPVTSSTSIIESVKAGEMDLTPAYMTVTSHRINMVPYIGPVFTQVHLEKKSYTAITFGDFYLHYILNPKRDHNHLSDLDRRFKAAAKRNPPLTFLNLEKIVEMLTDGGYPKKVLLTGDPVSFVRSDCRLKHSSYAEMGSTTSYVRKDLLEIMRPVDDRFRKVMNNEKNHLTRKYYANTNCPGFHPPLNLKLPQVLGIFALSGLLYAIGLICVVAEILYHQWPLLNLGN